MGVEQKALRRYHAYIERALTLFDANSDWADYIAFLSRLLKSLETGKPDGLSDVPCKARVALCLSRCLQPSLPSGVHQKALDVYAEVFSIIGVNGLSRDLGLFLPGLSHTLAFANLSTRPLVIDLFESHVLQIPPRSLRPALKALILSLLPVIEEETSEDFDRCLQTFERLRLCFSKEDQESFFWQTLFVGSIANPLRRAGVLVYLNRFLPKLAKHHADSASKSEVTTNPEPGLLVRCFATGLRDDNALVQRGFLDLLVTHLPLDASVLQAASYRKDLDVLVRAALMVVLRKDMSLNRRLWTWFAGTDSKVHADPVTTPLESTSNPFSQSNDYYTQFGLQSTTRAVQNMLSDASSQAGQRTIPFRILLSLLDRWEIGGPVVRILFNPIMKALMLYQSTAPTQSAFDEVFRSANVFFDGIEIATLYDCLAELLKSNELDLLSFIIANFNIEQGEQTQSHLVGFSLRVVQAMGKASADASRLVSLLNDLTAMFPAISTTIPVTNVAALLSELLQIMTARICGCLEQSQHLYILDDLCISFERVVVLNSDLGPIDIQLLRLVNEKLELDVSPERRDFAIVEVCSKICTGLLQRFSDLGEIIRQPLLDMLPLLIRGLWDFLSPRCSHHHVAVVEMMWKIHDSIAQQELVGSTILDILHSKSQKDSPDNTTVIEHFGALHQHTKTIRRGTDDVVPPMLQQPILYILDRCPGQDRNEAAIQWLLSLHSTSAMFKLALNAENKDEQEVFVTLQRVQKLVRIMYLSEEHWRTFSTSLDLHLVRDFCLTLIEKDKINRALAHEGFRLLRSLYDGRSGNTAPSELVVLLVDRLMETDSCLAQQEDVLDTLLTVLNDKSVLPTSLVGVLLSGISTIPTDERLDKWITLLCNFLPNHAALVPSLLKLTNNFCKRIENTFEDLQSLFNHKSSMSSSKNPDRSIANLLSGLEYVLARAHQQVFHNTMPTNQSTNGASQDTVSSRSKANDRLTVILCMQDTVRICAKLWCWKSTSKTELNKGGSRDSKAFQYISMRLRSRSRKILENLIEAETQECLETLVGMWVVEEQPSSLDLLQTLNGARPRAMLPAVFNAIYSRTNPGLVSSFQKSTISVPINSIELVTFLNQYTAALEDDMLEEIWSDCATFIKEVLANPMPHRQILIRLLRFCSILAQKLENTSFGEDSRMYRELADICARLFTAIFTIKPAGFDGSVASNEKASTTKCPGTGGDDMLQTLIDTLPHFGSLLNQADRISTIFTGIATNITSPLLHARAFPQNLTQRHLEVLRLMSASAGTSKAWRKDVLDSFTNPRFFQSSPELARSGWLPLVRQLQITDKSMLIECLNRIPSPAAAGIVLGIGATAARNEADRKSQLELRRVITTLMSTEMDATLPFLQQILQKIEDLFGATSESSPSLATRGDVYLLIRGLLLRTSHTNLTTLWPVLDCELRSLCKDMLAGGESRYTPYSKLQGAKLLDVLLLLRPDEFQLHEWVFVTDTIDAIYPSSTTPSVAYADEIAPVLASGVHHEPQTPSTAGSRKPWLYGKRSSEAKEVEPVLADFFGQLSIRVFEDLYSLQAFDEDAACDDLLADIFSGVD